MKKGELIKIVVPAIVVVILSVISYNYLIVFMSSFEISPEIQNQFESKIHIGLYTQCLVLFFALISLPFIFSVFAVKLKIGKNNLAKTILILELAGLFLAYITTPPDHLSTIIVFIVWQLPIIVNLITLLYVVKRAEEKA